MYVNSDNKCFFPFQELEVQKQDTLHMESNRGNNNNLLEYLRSLESSMVNFWLHGNSFFFDL